MTSFILYLLIHLSMIHSIFSYYSRIGNVFAAKQCHRSFHTATFVPDNERLEKEKHSLPKFYRSYIDYVLISDQVIQERVDQLAKDLLNDYEKHRHLHLLCVLKGSSIFFHDLLRRLIYHAQEIPIQIDYDFVRVSSYSNTQSTGEVKIQGISNLKELSQKHVLLVEDIVDTGHTMSKLIPYIQSQSTPFSVEVVSLLEKRLPSTLYKAKYVGFSIPNSFVVGYGLDYNEGFRDINCIGVLNQDGIDFWKEK